MKSSIRNRSPRKAGWRVGLLAAVVLAAWLAVGCGSEDASLSTRDLTYTYDPQVSELLRQVQKESPDLAIEDFDQTYVGLIIPDVEWSREPYVLALATRSRVPTILLLDAPWVRRYGRNGWLTDLIRRRRGAADQLALDQITPSLKRAFSLRDERGGKKGGTLLALPANIKGNVLFYRKDLMKKYFGAEEGPRTWADLIQAAETVLAGEKEAGGPLRYGLLFHINYFHNDFYPILWGYGGRVYRDGRLLLADQRDQAVAALTMLHRMVHPPAGRPALAPKPSEFDRFSQSKSLRQAFFNGQALFMINWNTRLNDLKDMALNNPAVPGGLTDIDAQVGWAPIPHHAGHGRSYVNIGSFGWGLNQAAMTKPEVERAAYRFLNLMASKPLQRMAALEYGHIPARMDVAAELKASGRAPDVIAMFETLNAEDVVLQPRPYRRDVGVILDRFFLSALKGNLAPEAAVDQAISAMRQFASGDDQP